MKYKRFLSNGLILALISLVLAVASCSSAGYPAPSDGLGKFLLTNAELNGPNVYRLDGNWIFTKNRLLAPSDEKNTGAYLQVPSLWNDSQSGGIGYGTYRTLLILDQTNAIVGFKFPNVGSSFRLYINGELSATNGVPGTNAVSTHPQFRTAVLYFHPRGLTNEILVQIANFSQATGGLFNTVMIGGSSAFNLYMELSTAFSLFLIGSLVIMGCYHIVLFLLRRKDRSTVMFGIFCLLFSGFTLFNGDPFIFRLFPDIGYTLFSRFQFLTDYLTVVAFMLYIHYLFPGIVSRIFLWITGLVSTVFYFLILFAPVMVFTSLEVPYQVFVLAAMGYLLYVMVIAVVRKMEGAVIMLAGCLIFFVTAVWDIRMVMLQVQSTYTMPFGLFMFIFSQSFMLSIRFSRAFLKVEDLSEKLVLYNDRLEHEVAQRTNELNEEKNLLKVKNSLMESELDMARKIQFRLIPSENPDPRISSYYRPMLQVGGDFFDYISFPGKEMIGIFISDVSGHGVAAAFITSMIKSVLIQVASYIDNPAELLMSLNGVLFGQTQGNFVTALYGIYDFRTRRFIYSSAGHNPPYLVSGSGEVSRLGLNHSGIPLAVLEDGDIRRINRQFTNENIVIEPGGKLFLYTDGLVEAVNINEKAAKDNPPDFETGMKDILREYSNLDSGRFLERISGKLREFRGSDEFDDDVCMICLDAR